MIHRRLGQICGSALSLSFVMCWSVSVHAASQESGVAIDDAVTGGTISAQPSVQEVANPQVVRIEQKNGTDALIDPRAKAAWLTECRRRANINGVTAPAKDSGTARSSTESYDYCEAYLDDYYRNYAQSAQTSGYVYQSQGLPQPAQLARTGVNQQAQQPYEEIITEEYVPVTTRRVARRTVPKRLNDKRVRLYPR